MKAGIFTILLLCCSNGIFTILLLCCSNVFMTFAWYGNLKLKEMHISTDWPLFLVIVASWGIAFFEYCIAVPAHRNNRF